MDDGGGSRENVMVGGAYTEEPHVLAVDDSLVDRKLVERLLKNSSCKGKTNLTFLSIFFAFTWDKKNM